MSLFKSDGGVMDVIRCDESDYLIWKWHPKGSIASSSKRANAIRWGSLLHVKDGSVAVFVYRQADGVMYDFIEGPYEDVIQTNNFPVLSTLIGTLYDGESPFQAEIYFINQRGLIQTKFGVPYFDVFDPRFLDYGVPVAVRGTINFKIDDYHEFIKVHSLSNFEMAEFQNRIRDTISAIVKSTVANIPDKEGIPVVQLERKISEITSIIESEISEALYDDYGVTVTKVDISAIEIDKDSEGYEKLQSLTQGKIATLIHATSNIRDTSDIQQAGANKIKRTFGAEAEKEPKKKVSINLDNAGQKIGSVFSGAISEIRKATEKQVDNIELLKQYKDLFDVGVITEEEFNEKKRELL